MNRRNFICEKCNKRAREDKDGHPRCPHCAGEMRLESVPRGYRSWQEYNAANWSLRVLNERAAMKLLKRLSTKSGR
jgi:hypothetical protein